MTKSRQELLAMPVRELKQILTERNIRWVSSASEALLLHRAGFEGWVSKLCV